MDSLPSTSSTEDVAPKSYDVLCGQSPSYNNYPGNKLLKESLQECVVAYHNEDKASKMLMTMRIVETLRKTYGTRFLQIRQGKWKVISDAKARDKISHALRFEAKKGRYNKLVKDDKVAPVASHSACCGPEGVSSMAELDRKEATRVVSHGGLHRVPLLYGLACQAAQWNALNALLEMKYRPALALQDLAGCLPLRLAYTNRVSAEGLDILRRP